ncbi:uncharacterized protein ColSpa_07695 [Colletotrichum spaethianum]|uniref:Uncharacterized protein n=1 Tax=Colletotrichum spaethianum TaxID=700344 RepID=A0AA37P8C4_9PEZI|nr:uncharacterized protein ColSpa_07695 [Colletotrichum spaethianum]GKT47514.1 hypothetical protein ColSpa_07695 [Colletotrichum spaethianum]
MDAAAQVIKEMDIKRGQRAVTDGSRMTAFEPDRRVGFSVMAASQPGRHFGTGDATVDVNFGGGWRSRRMSRKSVCLLLGGAPECRFD